MIWIAYILAIGVIVWSLQLVRHREPSPELAKELGSLRALAFALSVLLAILGGGLAGDSIREPGHSLSGDWPAYLLLGSLALGGLTYAVGAVLWQERSALRLRAVGWVFMVGALVVPSTLTLALPLVAALIVTLREIRPQQESGPLPTPGNRRPPASGTAAPS